MFFTDFGHVYTAADEIFDRLKNLTGDLVYTKPFNILALFTRNFERLDVSRRLHFRTVKGRILSWWTEHLNAGIRPVYQPVENWCARYRVMVSL